MFRFSWKSMLAAGVLLAALAPLPARAQTLHYKYAPGDVLAYDCKRVVRSIATEQTLEESIERIEIWCFAVEGEEAKLLLTITRYEGNEPVAVRGIVGWFDVRGQRRFPDEVRAQVPEFAAALELLPMLRGPVDRRHLWHTDPDTRGLTRQCELADDNDGQKERNVQRVAFTTEFPRDVGELIGSSEHGAYWFDTQNGYVKRAELHGEWRLEDRAVEQVVVFRVGRKCPSAWVGQRNEELRRYLVTLVSANRIVADALARPQRIAEARRQLERLWKGLADGLARGVGSPLTLIAQSNTRQVGQRFRTLAREAAYRGAKLGQAAPAWSLETVDGETLRSEDVRGKMTVECLWSLATPDFTGTLRELRRVETKLVDRPVTFVYLNLDTDAELARRAIRQMGMGGRHLLGGPLQSVERPPALPLVRLLDGDGVVQNIWIGWQPTYDELSTAVQSRARETEQEPE